MPGKTGTYRVISRLRRNGERYLPGSTIDLTREDAEPLINGGTLAAAGEGGPGAASRPDDAADHSARAEDTVIDAIMDRLAELQAEDIGADGKPLVASVEALVGYPLSEEEVDYAWQKHVGGTPEIKHGKKTRGKRKGAPSS